ncbi:MAG: hypothetical protein L3J82_03110 [Planctomycetes bacterium]|nr:hypothetical protein [Planctomycetota bacterium]
MSTVTAQTVDVTSSIHQIATNRSLQSLMEWAQEFADQEQAAGRRTLWAPCQALQGSVSLRSWIMERASQLLGHSAPIDAPTLLSGATDILIIVDPAAADQGSLNWIAELLACANEVSDITTVPPLPQLVVLAPGRKGGDEKVVNFVDRLRDLGAKELRTPGRQADPTPESLSSEISKLKKSHGSLLATLSLMPSPLDQESLDALAVSCGAGKNAVDAIRNSELFFSADGLLFPTTKEIGSYLRKQFSEAELNKAAQALLPVCEARFEGLPDARVEVLMLAGDQRRATKLARRRFDDHYDSGRFEEAMRILRLAGRLGLSMESGKHAKEIDQAKMATLLAENGDYDQAKALLVELNRNRKLFDSPEYVRWMGLAARALATKINFEPRQADSLLRRAVRLCSSDTDMHVRLTLLRVQLLRSNAFRLEDRADWLLSHVSQSILENVSKATLAQYLSVSATRLVAKGDFKGAFKRLRHLTTIAASDRELGHSMLMMARCRSHVSDHESAVRYALGSLQYGLRAADLELVQDAAKLLRLAEKEKPSTMPKLITRGRGKIGRGGRIPSAAEIQTPQTTDAEQIFEIMESRFGVLHWERRRRGAVNEYGKSLDTKADSISIYQENADGTVTKKCEAAGVHTEFRGIVLMRADGDDLVCYEPQRDAEPREDLILKFLLADRAPEAVSVDTAAPPRRTPVVNEYMRRAVAHGTQRGLHATMEMLFNKDLLIYLEEQGLGKEDMAEKLGVSRATLYRMFARSGLN